MVRNWSSMRLDILSLANAASLELHCLIIVPMCIDLLLVDQFHLLVGLSPDLVNCDVGPQRLLLDWDLAAR